MENYAYLNDTFVPISEAKISPLDRGFLFGDSIYECIPVYYRSPRAIDLHIVRLQNSLTSIEIPFDCQDADLKSILYELIERNNMLHQYIYVQISRGSNGFRRSHFLPDPCKPTLFIFGQEIDFPSEEKLNKGFSAITVLDTRWHHTSIKSTNVLPNILQLQKAVVQGAAEAILTSNGYIIEGAGSNIFMVKDNCIITPPAQERMLSGITRKIILDLTKRYGIPSLERPILKEEIWRADELFFTNSPEGLIPIISVDEKIISQGQVGSVWKKMFYHYLEYITPSDSS